MNRAPTCSAKASTARTCVLPPPLVIGLVALLLVGAASGLGAQEDQRVAQAVAAACGPDLDPAREGVLAGTVTDSVSGVPLANARVSIQWRALEDSVPLRAEATSDAQGFYAFCGVPGGVAVLLVAEFAVPSAPITVGVESGMLHVQPIRMVLSDPDEPGVLVGRVVDAGTRRPIAGADVILADRGLRALTNNFGYFTFGELPWGIYALEVANLGYADRTVPVRVSGALSQMAEIGLSAEAIELEGLTVTARDIASRTDLDGLVRRMSLGFGSFLTREVLEKRPMARLFDFLREVPGVWVDQHGFDATMTVRGRPCDPIIYVNGVERPTWTVDSFVTQDLEAIEVYRGYAQIPGEFLRPSMGLRPCAVVAIWTRPG